MKTVFYKIIFEPQEEGGFTVYVPKLPGCVSEGDTYNEAFANIKEALELYLSVQKERNIDFIYDDTHISEVGIAV
jgi:predicted RNase H-like HicB family nuclease